MDHRIRRRRLLLLPSKPNYSNSVESSPRSCGRQRSDYHEGDPNGTVDLMGFVGLETLTNASVTQQDQLCSLHRGAED